MSLSQSPTEIAIISFQTLRLILFFIHNKSLQQNRTEILASTGNLIESPCFYTKLTVFENLKYLDIIYDKGNKRIDEVLELVDLHNYKNKKI